MISATTNYVNANAAGNKKPLFAVEISGYTRIFTNRNLGVTDSVTDRVSWLVSIDDHSQTVNELDGGADIGDFTFTVLDYRDALTADMATFVFEGKQVRLMQGFEGLDLSDYVTLFTGHVTQVDSIDEGTAYAFTCSDNRDRLSKVIFETADDGQPTDSDHRKTLNAHPIDIAISVLEDQCGYLASEIDVAKLEQYRDDVFAGVQFTFSIDSPPEAREFLEQEIFKPLGGYMWTDANGKVSANFMFPLSTSVVGSLDRDHIVGIPDVSQVDLINVVSYRFDHDSEQNKFLSEDVETYDASVTKYGLYGQHVIESNGVRSGLQGFLLSATISRQLFYRYGLKNIQLADVQCLWKRSLFEPGDLIPVTHDRVPDRNAGVRGLSQKVFQVFDRSWNFYDGTVTYRLLEAGFLDNFGQFKIANESIVPNFTSATAEEKATYMFLCNDSDQYSDSSPANVLG